MRKGVIPECYSINLQSILPKVPSIGKRISVKKKRRCRFVEGDKLIAVSSREVDCKSRLIEISKSGIETYCVPGHRCGRYTCKRTIKGHANTNNPLLICGQVLLTTRGRKGLFRPLRDGINVDAMRRLVVVVVRTTIGSEKW